MTEPRAPHAPPYCPNPNCSFHRNPTGWRYKRAGYHERLFAPQRIQRYRCCHCRRHFCEQTFRVSYWLKRPDLLEPVFHGMVACAAFRQLARSLNVSPQTIATHAARLGRLCLLFHDFNRPKGPFAEEQVLDSFQSFEYSQYTPTLFHLIGSRDSHFFHGFTDSELRRSGSMRKGQKKRRAKLEAQFGKPDPASIRKEVAVLMQIVLPKPQALVLHSDLHEDYPRAFKAVPHLSIEHHKTSSRAARTSENKLFPVNLMDLLIRHSGANHKRETIAFSKRRQSAAERLWITLVWRNWMKWFSERRHEWTPAMKAGVATEKLGLATLLRERLFVTRNPLPERWADYYWRKIPTRHLRNCRSHALKYAF